MKVILDIKDSKAAAFINFIKSLDFIRILTKDDYDEPTKHEILESVKQGMSEVKLHEEGKLELQSAKDFLNEL